MAIFGDNADEWHWMIDWLNKGERDNPRGFANFGRGDVHHLGQWRGGILMSSSDMISSKTSWRISMYESIHYDFDSHLDPPANGWAVIGLTVNDHHCHLWWSLSIVKVCNTAVADTCPSNPPPPHDKVLFLMSWVMMMLEMVRMITLMMMRGKLLMMMMTPPLSMQRRLATSPTSPIMEPWQPFHQGTPLQGQWWWWWWWFEYNMMIIWLWLDDDLNWIWWWWFFFPLQAKPTFTFKFIQTSGRVLPILNPYQAPR